MPHLFGLWSGVTGGTGFAIIRVLRITSDREQTSTRSANQRLVHRFGRIRGPGTLSPATADAPPPPRLCFRAVPQPRIRKGPDTGARAWTWALRHTQAPPLRVPIGDRDSHHGARPPRGNAHGAGFLVLSEQPPAPPSSPEPRQRRVNLHIVPWSTPGTRRSLRASWCSVRARLHPSLPRGPQVAHAPPRHAIHASGENALLLTRGNRR